MLNYTEAAQFRTVPRRRRGRLSYTKKCQWSCDGHHWPNFRQGAIRIASCWGP